MNVSNITGSPRTTGAGALAILVGGIGEQVVPKLVQYLGGQPGLLWQAVGLACGLILPALMADAKERLDKLSPKAPGALLALIVGASLFAGSARAADAQPEGPLPSLGACAKIKGKDVCVQPTVMVASVVDLRSGNIERGVALGAGYAVILPRAFYGHDLGVNAVGGILTGGNWQASLSPRIGNAFAGITVSHKNGVNYAGANFGVAY